MPINEIPENKPDAPEDLTEVSESSPGNPSDLTEVAESAPGNPSNLSEVSESSPGNPADLTEVADSSPGNPNNLAEVSESSPVNPNNLSEVAESSPGNPSNLSEVAESSPGNPSNLSEVSEVTPGNPINLSEVSLASPGNPTTLTALAEAVLPRTITPVVDLNFAANTYEYLGDGDDLLDIATYSRASSGTYVERYRNHLGQYDYYLKEDFVGTTTNLLTYSEDFSNADWTKTNVSIVPNAETNPIDGAQTATKLVESVSAVAVHTAYQAATVSSTAELTFSVYAKAAEREWIVIYDQNAVEGHYFNVKTGDFGAALIGAPNTESIRYIKDGWYLITIQYTAPATSAQPRIYIADENDSFQYAGDGTSGIFIYGAQLTESVKAEPYVKTLASSDSTTFTATPRLEWDAATGEALGYLSERAGTNVMLQSESLNAANGWTESFVTMTLNADIAPDLTRTANRMTDDATNNAHRIFKTVTVVNSTVYTLSLFAKAQGITNIYFPGNPTGASSSGQAIVNLADGTITESAGDEVQVFPVGNGWYRVSKQYTSTSTSMTPQIWANNGAYLGSGNSLLIWGVQLEASSYPTSYVRTQASTASRSADLMSVSTGALAKGSLNFEAKYLGTSSLLANARVLNSITDGTSSNRHLFYNASGLAVQYLITTAGSTVANPQASSSNDEFFTSTGTWETNSFNLYYNGELAQSDTSGVTPGIKTLYVGSETNIAQLDGHIKSVQLYNKVLTASEISKL